MRVFTLSQRLFHQDLLPQRSEQGKQRQTPQDIVAHQGALQAQDYAGAKWAIGLRLPQLTDKDLEAAFSKGELIRTHILRPTWHFVAPQDLRWMLSISAPRVHAVNASMCRKVGLDSAFLKRSNDLMARALEGGRHLTRNELAAVLKEGGMDTGAEFKMAYIMMHAELDAVVCSGPRKGKQFTYALFDEWVAPAKPLPREEALAELARRYFISRGPATVADFVWWSGLTVAQAKTALASIQSELARENREGADYWCSPERPNTADLDQANYLLPNYDEYFIGFRDRSALLPPDYQPSDSRGMLTNVIILKGLVSGSWQRSFLKGGISFELKPFRKMSAEEQAAMEKEMERYARFFGEKMA